MKIDANLPLSSVAPLELQGLTTALVLDALDSIGLRYQGIHGDILPRTVDGVVSGRAKTLLWADFAHEDPDTYALELRAVDSVEAGQILVCATGGSRRSGIWGELLTTAALRRGALGLITDGAVRDISQMKRQGFPIFSRHISAYDSFGRQKVIACDVPVEVAGVTIEPNDLIIGDCDGIAVVPASRMAEVQIMATSKMSREHEFRAAVQTGMSLTSAYERFKVL